MRILPRLTYANVVATLALFVALGGSSYAALKLTGKDIKDGSLTGKDVKNESLRSRDVSGLTARDFRGGRLPAGPTGPQGAKGDRGLTGETGAMGPVGPAGPPGPTYFANVNVDISAPHTTTLAHHKGVVSVTRKFAGYYLVKFDRDVSKCAGTVTPGASGEGNQSSVYLPMVQNDGGFEGNLPPDTFLVLFFNQGDNQTRDTGFHLIVACP